MKTQVVAKGMITFSLLVAWGAAQAQIHVDTARIGCLDIQKDPNMTSLVANACNGKMACGYKAPTESEYRRAGVVAKTRTFCTQGMEITYHCAGNSPTYVVEVPGDAWTRDAAYMRCDAPRPGPSTTRGPGSPCGSIRPGLPEPNCPLNVVALGDSIMWGQGLPERMKFRNLVKQWIEQQYQGTRKVNVFTHAHSGAVTGFGAYPKETGNEDPDAYYLTALRSKGYPYPGEVPFDYPSVSGQIAMLAKDIYPADVDLVLLDGGINDVSVQNILNVTDVTTNPAWVRKITEQSCVGHMAKLLPQVLSAFPHAAVIITGYYSIVSSETDPNVLKAMLGFHGITTLAASISKDELTERSNAFSDAALSGYTQLVNDTNRGLGRPRVALAWPGFTAANSYGAPNRYLFLLGEFEEDEERGKKWQAPPGDWSTPQGIAYYRGEECSKDNPSSITCFDASMGHPNPAGAQAYASAIIAQLEQFPEWVGIGRLRLAAAPQTAPVNVPTNIVVNASDLATGQPVANAVVHFGNQVFAAGRPFPHTFTCIQEPNQVQVRGGRIIEPRDPNPPKGNTGTGQPAFVSQSTFAVTAPAYLGSSVHVAVSGESATTCTQMSAGGNGQGQGPVRGGSPGNIAKPREPRPR